MTARLVLICWVVALCGCASSSPDSNLRVAAASNLSDSLTEIAQHYEQSGYTKVVLSFGSTAQLAQQIEYGAPFDIFVSADTEHVDGLVKKGLIVPESRTTYAMGQLALWIPKGGTAITDLAKPEIRYVAIAQPELAPYGKAAVESLKTSGVWEAVSPKLVYANSVGAAREMVETGNADAALTAYSLVLHKSGSVAIVGSHAPIEQALGITKTARRDTAQRFRDYVMSSEGQSILRSNGYESPTSYRP